MIKDEILIVVQIYVPIEAAILGQRTSIKLDKNNKFIMGNFKSKQKFDTLKLMSDKTSAYFPMAQWLWLLSKTRYYFYYHKFIKIIIIHFVFNLQKPTKLFSFASNIPNE